MKKLIRRLESIEAKIARNDVRLKRLAELTATLRTVLDKTETWESSQTKREIVMLCRDALKK